MHHTVTIVQWIVSSDSMILSSKLTVGKETNMATVTIGFCVLKKMKNMEGHTQRRKTRRELSSCICFKDYACATEEKMDRLSFSIFNLAH